MKNKYLLPKIDDISDQLKGAAVVCKIDIRTSYHQVRIKEEYNHNTTSRMMYGHYEFTIVPFRLANSLETFMFLMNNVLRPYLEKIVLVFVHEILDY